MDNNGKDTKHTRHISIIVNIVINGENCKIHNIDQCEGGLKLTYISTKNVGETDLNPGMKYIMVSLDNLYNTCTRGVKRQSRFYGTSCSI